MPALVAGIHVFLPLESISKTWMAGTSPAMTGECADRYNPPLLALDVELARDRAPDFHLAGQERAQLLRALQRQRDLLGLGELRGDALLADDGGQLGAEARD